MRRLKESWNKAQVRFLRRLRAAVGSNCVSKGIEVDPQRCG
jgi:hypothetical protein